MTIIATNFTKIVVERKGAVRGKVSIANNVSIKSVDTTDIAIGASKQSALKFSFEFSAKYEPNMGSIVLNGELIFLEKPEKVKELAAEWKKSKKVPKEIMAPILNNILTKCNIEALILSKEMNMPPPVQLPKVNVKK